MDNSHFKLEGYDKLPTFKVTGGLGKHIVFSSLIPHIVKKYGRINVLSAYPEVFQNNGDIQLSLGLIEYESFTKECSKVIEKIFYQEPYGTEFDFNNQHILEWWAERYCLSVDMTDISPKVFLDQNLIQQSMNILRDIGDKFILVQFSGGQSPIDFDGSNEYATNRMTNERNYPYQMAQILVNKIRFQFPEYKIINVSLPNEYNLLGTERIPVNFRVYFELVKHASVIISIDSMLQHISATSGKNNTIVLWNSLSYTPKHKFGWKQHINLQERDLCIDYNEVIETIKKLSWRD